MSFIQYYETRVSSSFVYIDNLNHRFFNVVVENGVRDTKNFFIYTNKGVCVRSERGFETLTAALDAATKVITSEV